jgi:predicted patatin/cPLA2 family phospholipase
LVNNVKWKHGRSALVVEGGGMRGMFTAGVLHAFGSAGFDPFDLYIGVSAGACNLASHLAGQNDRNYDINTKYSATPEFINVRRFLLGGHLMDIDWLWDISMKEYPLDLEHLFSKLEKERKEFIVVATSVESGRALYLTPCRNTIDRYIKVSSSVPFFYRNILEVDSEKATDGGVADSIPVIEAFNRGATDITVLRTRHSDYVKKKSVLAFLYPLFFKKHRVLARALRDRPVAYMKSVEFIKNPPEGVRINEIAPPKDLKVRRATKDLEVLKTAYRTGIEYGERFMERYNRK